MREEHSSTGAAGYIIVFNVGKGHSSTGVAGYIIVFNVGKGHGVNEIHTSVKNNIICDLKVIIQDLSEPSSVNLGFCYIVEHVEKAFTFWPADCKQKIYNVV